MEDFVFEQQEYLFKSKADNFGKLLIKRSIPNWIGLGLGLIIKCILYSFIRPFGASYIQVRLIIESVL